MEIGRMAAKHLIKLGHRRILQASLLNGSNSVIEKECRDGFVEVMRNAGMPFGNEFEISSMDQQIEGDFSAAFIAHECFLGPLRDFVRSEQRAKKMDVVVFSNALQSDSTMKVHTIVSPIKKLAEQSTRLLIDKITSDCDTAGYVLLKPEILSSPAK
jgi:DNA-binding LacI/PurR family transcriptional regulator